MRRSLESVLDRAGRLVREWRAKRRRWSAASDRAFHQGIYAEQNYDPFTPSYPGYVTIRRFADLADEAITDSTRLVVDLGCGPGEITCELARRHRAVSFAGFDHSENAIARARANAARLSLANVRFDTADITRVELPTPTDLIVLFDAFHHIVEPAEFVTRLRQKCAHFFLIEPAGEWHGGWGRQSGFEWLMRDLDSVRARLDAALGRQPVRHGAADGAAAGDAGGGEAVERRYTLHDFERFFSSLAIDIRGTVAGLDEYPPEPYAFTPLRDRFGEFACELFEAIDDALLQMDADLGARHWALHIHPGTPGLSRGMSRAAFGVADEHERTVRGQYDAEFGPHSAPAMLHTGASAVITLHVGNRGWQAWRSDTEPPVMLSYHWCLPDGEIVSEGGRTPLRRPVGPGEQLDATLHIVAPTTPGIYQLSIDLVHEGVTWFSEAGSPPLDLRVEVRA